MSYLSCKGKIFLEPVLDTLDEIVKYIEIKSTGLSEIVEEYLVLNRITVQEMQQILDGLLDLSIKKMIENTITFYCKEGDQIMGVLDP